MANEERLPVPELHSSSIKGHLGVRGNQRRPSVACESYDPEADVDGGEEVTESFPKADEERSRIQERLKHVFIFRVLDDTEMEQIVDALEPRQYHAGDVIIQEGDDGDFFYVVDKGHFQATTTAAQGKVVANYNDSGSFGELALLHNQPRSATISAVSDGALWAMSRTTFRRLVIKRAYEKRRKYMSLLGKVSELEPLTEYERMQVADALRPVRLLAGHTLFKEGDDPDGLYLVESGRLSVTQLDPKKQAQEVNQVGPEDFVGEMALVNDKKRSATITALENTDLAFLDKDAFERLLGPCLKILERKSHSYRRVS